jgi:[ribosomal protein S18]-alanine N-acetyltransferase
MDMRYEHLDGVLAIEGRSFPSPWTRSAFAGHLEHPEFAKYIVALNKETVVGYSGLFFGGGQGQLTNLAVHPDWRRQGVGSRLLLEMIDYCLALGLEGLSLEVRTANEEAQELYEKFGFRKVGVRKGYYQETGEDAFVMCVFDLNDPDFQERLEEIRKGLTVK